MGRCSIMPERTAAHEFYRVVNAYADTFTRVCQLVGAVTRDDDPDVQPCRIVRFSDDTEGAFYREELEPFDGQL